MNCIKCILFALLLGLLVGPGAIANANVNGRVELQEKRVEVLDSRYTVEWQADFEAKEVEFLVRVQTTGFVGFGLSMGGTMNGGDIVIGGVHPNGTKYFADYHGTGYVPPVLDETQNWELIDAVEANGFTVLRFKRLMGTCDEDDEPITAGTVKLIWAIGATDTISRHLPSDRGALAVNMLDPPLPPVDLSAFDKDIVPMEYELLPEETVYWCTIHKRVPKDGKSHIVAFKPILNTTQALKHTHHFNMYTCRGPNLEAQLKDYEGQGMDCHGDYAPRLVCQSNLYAWSFGGRLLVFPDDIGFPWGTDTVEYFLFEAHFDNPSLDAGKHIETGVEIYHTKELREHEAGMLSVGHTTTPSLMIPPRTGDWTLVGHCSSACTTTTIAPEKPGTGIRLFNANLHAHKSGRKMKLRHFRSGQELAWLAKDYTYDFDFQENRPLREAVELLPGDHLSLECTYDSNWRSPHSAVIGGASTQDEMCMAFLFYYPKVPLEACFSGYSNERLLTRLGLEEWTTGSDPTILKPVQWAGLLFSQFLTHNVSWTQAEKDALLQELRYGVHDDFCHTLDVPKFALDGVPIRGLRNLPRTSYPDFEHEYEEETAECNGSNAVALTPHCVSVSIVAAVLLGLRF